MKELDKIVLIGYMASGKTAVGKQLAIALKIPFIDLDDYIAEKEALSISELFEQKGEPYFRKKEIVYIKELLDKKEVFVLSVGGGTPCFLGTMELINEFSLSIYLKATNQTLYNRLVPKKIERPVLSNIAEDMLQDYIAIHLFERSAYYEQAAISTSVDELSIEEIVKNIQKEINTYSKKA